MKIFQKRICAVSIDTLLFGSVFIPIIKIMPDWYLNTLGAFGYLIFFVPFFCRDFLFRNASLGKKLMGIAIYDNRWQKPTLSLLFKRSFLTYTVGYTKYIKSKCYSGESAMVLFDWERDAMKTRVIDKNVFRLLQEKVGKDSKTYAEDMTRLYNEYLRNLYL